MDHECRVAVNGTVYYFFEQHCRLSKCINNLHVAVRLFANGLIQFADGLYRFLFPVAEWLDSGQQITACCKARRRDHLKICVEFLNKSWSADIAPNDAS